MKKMILMTLSLVFQSHFTWAAGDPNQCRVTEKRGSETQVWLLDLKPLGHSTSPADDTAAQAGCKLFKNMSTEINKAGWDGINEFYYISLYQDNVNGKGFHVLSSTEGAVFASAQWVLDADKDESIQIQCPSER